AGVGKTRLLTELRDVAFTEGWQVFAGHCLDFGDSALPYLPFSEVMGRLATDLPDVVEAASGAHPPPRRLPHAPPCAEGMGRLAPAPPDVVETVPGVHPALGRLQPGRRMLSGASEDAGSVD